MMNKLNEKPKNQMFQMENFNLKSINLTININIKKITYNCREKQNFQNDNEKVIFSTKNICFTENKFKKTNFLEKKNTISNLPKIMKLFSIKNQIYQETSRNKKIKKMPLKKTENQMELKGCSLLQKNIKNIFFSTVNKDFIFLKKEEQKIFLKILNKKMQTNYSYVNELNKENLDKINQFCGVKRLEEEFKFIFKRSIKFLKNNFKIKNPLLKKNSINQNFYLFYFKNLADKLKLPLNYFSFEDSKFKRQKYKIKCHKTINRNYRNLILKSKLFSKDFKNYLDNFILLEFEKDILHKLNKIFEKWINLLNAKNFNQIEMEIDNNKISFPWTINELKKAIQSIKKNMNFIKFK